jgi:hypothetical protein
MRSLSIPVISHIEKAAEKHFNRGLTQRNADKSFVFSPRLSTFSRRPSIRTTVQCPDTARSRAPEFVAPSAFIPEGYTWAGGLA